MSRSRYTSLVHSVERRQADLVAGDLTRLVGSLHTDTATPEVTAPIERAREHRRVRRECNQRHKSARVTASSQ